MQKEIPISDLEPYDFSTEMYRQETPNQRFIESIAENSLDKRIIACETDDGIEIIDGVRRWLAARELDFETVPVDIREYEDEAEKKEAVLRHNDDRNETFYQKMRVALAHEETVAPRLKERMERGESLDEMDDDPAQNFGDGENVTSRGLAADRVGWSRETLRKAEKVWTLAHDEGIQWAEEAIEAINEGERSVHSAYEEFKKWERRRELDAPVEWQDYFRASSYSVLKRCDWVTEEMGDLVDEDEDWLNQLTTLVNQLDEETGNRDLSGTEYIFAYRLELEGYADFSATDAPISFTEREPDTDELWEMYWEEGLTKGQLAVFYGVNVRLINYWLWKKGIPQRYTDVESTAKPHLNVSVAPDGGQKVEYEDNTVEYEEPAEVNSMDQPSEELTEGDAAEW